MFTTLLFVAAVIFVYRKGHADGIRFAHGKMAEDGRIRARVALGELERQRGGAE